MLVSTRDRPLTPNPVHQRSREFERFRPQSSRNTWCRDFMPRKRPRTESAAARGPNRQTTRILRGFGQSGRRGPNRPTS